MRRAIKGVALVCLLLFTGFAVLSSFAVVGHPRLFFDRSGLDKLQTKAGSTQGKRSIDAVVDYAKYCAKKPPVKPTDYGTSYAGHLDAAQSLVCSVETMAFSWLMTKDEVYARTAKEYLFSLRTWESWQDDPGDDLSMAFISRGLSVGYDWLYEYLTPEEKTIFRGLIEKSAGWIYSESVKEKQSWTTSYAQNHLAISHVCLGLAGLTLLEEHPDAEKWVALAVLKVGKYLDNGSPDGAWGEGVHYWHYGTYQILLFADALRFITGKDLFQHSWLRDAWHFPFYCLSPTRQGLVNFCDCNYDASLVEYIGVTMLRLAAEYRNEYAQWFGKITDATVKTGLHRSPWNFIWYDLSVPATEPNDIPLSKLFREVGWGIFRTGWKDDDTLFALRAGSWWVHNHADQNGFILESRGERLAIDLGYGKRYSGYFTNTKDPYVGSIGHNTLLVDSLGQQLKQSGKLPLDGGYIRSFMSAPGYDYLLGDASATYSYPLQLFTRQVTFVKPSYLIMCDDLKSTMPSLFSWLLHTAGTIEVKEDTILVKGNKASLMMKILSPQKWSGQVLYDQKHMVGWEKEQPIQYVKIEPQSKLERLQFLLVMVPVPPQTDTIPFSITGISEALVLGVTISRADITDRHLYSLTGGRVSIGNIEFEGRNCFISSKAEGNIQQFALHDGASLRSAKAVLATSSRPLSIAMTLGNDTGEGSVETTEDCTLEMALQDQPAMVLLDGNRFEDYRYDAERRTLILSLRKGLHSLRIWWQSSYKEVEQLLRLARERYEETRTKAFSSQSAVALVDQSNDLIQKAAKAFERNDPTKARTLGEEALRLLGEAATAELRYQAEIRTRQEMEKYLQVALVSAGGMIVAALLLYKRRKKRVP